MNSMSGEMVAIIWAVFVIRGLWLGIVEYRAENSVYKITGRFKPDMVVTIGARLLDGLCWFLVTVLLIQLAVQAFEG